MSSLPKPYWQDEKRGLVIYLGDSRILLPCFADGEFGSVITDSPYGVGTADWDIPPDSAILAECLRVGTGTVCMFGGAPLRSLQPFLALEPPPDRLLIWAPLFSFAQVRSDGLMWKWQPIYAWRPNSASPSVPHDVLRHSTSGGRNFLNHPAKKPSSLMADLLRAFGGASVLDPYLGSGTTLAACAKLGIPGTGIEISEAYCEMAAARLTEDLSYGEPNLFNQEEPK